MAMRAAFTDILRFSFKFGPIPVLPLFSGGILDLPRTELSSAASQKLFCALYCRAWATALLGLGLRILQEQLGLALKSLGPTIAPQNPAYPTSWLERRVLVNPDLQYGLFNSALH